MKTQNFQINESSHNVSNISFQNTNFYRYIQALFTCDSMVFCSDCLFDCAHRRIVGSIALRYRSRYRGSIATLLFSVQFWRGIMNTNGARLFFTASRQDTCLIHKSYVRRSCSCASSKIKSLRPKQLTNERRGVA